MRRPWRGVPPVGSDRGQHPGRAACQLSGAEITGVCLPGPQSYTFLISSDYERAEWRENIREQQKKCEWLLNSDGLYLGTLG